MLNKKLLAPLSIFGLLLPTVGVYGENYNDQCKDNLIVVVPGTYEVSGSVGGSPEAYSSADGYETKETKEGTRAGSELEVYAKILEGSYKSNKQTTQIRTLKYAASALGYENTSGKSYKESLATGKKKLIDYLRAKNTQCNSKGKSKTKFSVLGYSQGAQLVGDVMALMGQKSATLGITPTTFKFGYLLSDPARIPGQIKNVVGTKAPFPGLVSDPKGIRKNGFGLVTKIMFEECDSKDKWCSNEKTTGQNPIYDVMRAFGENYEADNPASAGAVINQLLGMDSMGSKSVLVDKKKNETILTDIANAPDNMKSKTENANANTKSSPSGAVPNPYGETPSLSDSKSPASSSEDPDLTNQENKKQKNLQSETAPTTNEKSKTNSSEGQKKLANGFLDTLNDFAEQFKSNKTNVSTTTSNPTENLSGGSPLVNLARTTNEFISQLGSNPEEGLNYLGEHIGDLPTILCSTFKGFETSFAKNKVAATYSPLATNGCNFFANIVNRKWGTALLNDGPQFVTSAISATIQTAQWVGEFSTKALAAAPEMISFATQIGGIIAGCTTSVTNAGASCLSALTTNGTALLTQLMSISQKIGQALPSDVFPVVSNLAKMDVSTATAGGNEYLTEMMDFVSFITSGVHQNYAQSADNNFAKEVSKAFNV